jgi:microcystin-dependent protein
MAEFYLGQIIQGGWNFAPRGTALCNGQLLSIPQFTALFSLLGTTFGGNGTTTFGLPNLQGRVPIHWGQSLGTSTYVIGQSAGNENETLLVGNLPAHTHTATFASTSSFNASGAQPLAVAQIPHAGAVLGHSVDTSPVGSAPAIYCPAGTATPIALGGLNVAGTVSVGVTGGSQPFSILQPYLAITFAIVLQGIYPTRD